MICQGVGFRITQIFDELQKMLGDAFSFDDPVAEYSSDAQQVHYVIRRVGTKSEFRDALETSDLHVIYDGHARYGRGPCFGDGDNNSKGDQWEMGTVDPDNPYDDPAQAGAREDGIFRLGYPYVPVEIEDVEHHQYHFAPVPAENDPPEESERHPDARRKLTAITLPEPYRELVLPDYVSESNQYWGFKTNQINLLFNAGWTDSFSSPLDLGGVNLQCKCFCHFGCSSRLHCWKLVRSEDYKGWMRDDPPTDRFAYFSTNTTTIHISIYWLYYLLKYDKPNANASWWDSLEYAKKKANTRLMAERRGFQIY